MKTPLSALLFSICLLSSPAWSALTAGTVKTADIRKTLSYVKDGLVVGGDRAIDEVVIKDIRRSSNPGFERVVIDLEGTLNGEVAAIPRPPFYQVAVSPEEKRLVVTFWGKPKLAFDSNRVATAFKKSKSISSVELLPKVEADTWTFVLDLKKGSPVEVFELSNPARVILDIRQIAGK